jgi:hypothetical protein
MPDELQEEKSPDKVETELEGTRDRLAGLLAELTRRRHELIDVGLQLRRHKVAVGAAVGAALVLLSGGIALAVHRSRSERQLGRRARRLREAVGRMVAHPERVAGGQNTAGQAVLKVVLTTFAGVLARRLATRTMAAMARRPAGEPAASIAVTRPAPG